MSKKILLVDDDRNVQRTLAEALEMEGFDVLREKDGEWAIKTFSSKKPDAVVLDLLIPVFNGFQVAEKIRLLPHGKNVPIIMISGIYRGMNYRIDAKKRFDVVEYLDKPVRIEQLVTILKDVFKEDYPSAKKKRTKSIAPNEPAAEEPYADRETAQEAEEAEKMVRTGMRKKADSAISGDLKETSFPRLLHRLHRERLTGALLLRRKKIKKIVYFKDGYPVSVKSNLLNECLGRILVEEQIITENQCQESIRQMQRSKRQQGTILIEMGAISPHNLNWALQQQLETKLHDIFAWPNGEYRFTRQAKVPAATVQLEATPAELIYEGIRKKFDPDRMRNELEALSRKFVDRSPDPIYGSQDMGLDPDEEAFLLQLDGTQSVYDLIAYGPLGELHARQLLYALISAEIVYLLDVARIPPPPQDAGPPPLREVSGVHVPKEIPRLDRLGKTDRLTLTEEERNTREKLANYFMEIKNKDYFQILDVPRNASRWEIKKAFLELAKEFHPDKHFGTATKEIKEIAEEIFAIISKAHDVLTDDQDRAEYLRQLSGGRPKDVSDEVNKILAAEGQFQKGEALLRKKKYDEAVNSFKEAVDLYGDEGEFHAYLGWAQYNSNPGDPSILKKARQHLQTAIRLNPKLDKAYLFLGYIYKSNDQRHLAEQQFEKAIQCNPDCVEALQELKLISRSRRRR
ncbi:MAG: response regulator [Deltaproteobacteria bacterium]|nr:response regulator [Deltaproteobacteria bacterium]